MILIGDDILALGQHSRRAPHGKHGTWEHDHVDDNINASIASRSSPFRNCLSKLYVLHISSRIDEGNKIDAWGWLAWKRPKPALMCSDVAENLIIFQQYHATINSALLETWMQLEFARISKYCIIKAHEESLGTDIIIIILDRRVNESRSIVWDDRKLRWRRHLVKTLCPWNRYLVSARPRQVSDGLSAAFAVVAQSTVNVAACVGNRISGLTDLDQCDSIRGQQPEV